MGKRRYSDKQLRIAVSTSRTMREVLTGLGVAPRGGNYEAAWRRIRELGIDASHLVWRSESARRLKACSDDEIARAVRESRSYAQVLAMLGIRPGALRRV